jgi:hypothetical protein
MNTKVSPVRSQHHVQVKRSGFAVPQVILAALEAIKKRPRRRV